MFGSQWFASSAGVTFEYTAQSGANTTATDFSGQFDGIAIGAATSDRLVVVGISGSRVSAGARTVSSCSIGGVSASLVVRQTTTNGDACEMWAATVPSGTTADIDIVFSASMNGAGVGVWTLKGAATTATATAGDDSTPYSASLAIPEGGAGIGYFLEVDESGTTTWTNLTEDFDALIRPGAAEPFHSGAHSTTSGTLTRTAAGHTARTYYALVLAAFGPA